MALGAAAESVALYHTFWWSVFMRVMHSERVADHGGSRRGAFRWTVGWHTTVPQLLALVVLHTAVLRRSSSLVSTELFSRAFSRHSCQVPYLKL